jgi:hypothetical protein
MHPLASRVLPRKLMTSQVYYLRPSLLAGLPRTQFDAAESLFLEAAVEVRQSEP